MNTGYLAAFGTLLSWTVSAFIFGKLTRLTEPGLLNKAILFFSIFLLGIVVCVMDRINPIELFSLPNQSNWLWLGLSGIIGKSLGDYCGLSCLRILGPRRRYMISTLTPGFTLLFGFIILGEKINAIGMAGMFITILSLFLLLNSQTEKAEVKLEKFGNHVWGIFMGLCGAALTAVAFIIAKKGMVQSETSISEFHGTWIRVIVAFIVLFVVDLFLKRNKDFVTGIITNRQKAILLFWGIVFGVILGLSLSLVAITRLEVAVAYTIFSVVPLTVILASVIFFRKKIPWQSWIYSLMAIAGVIVLVWKDWLAGE